MPASRISYQKKCEFCEQTFTAKKLTTRFCSAKCAGRAFDKRLEEEKLLVNKNQMVLASQPIEILNNTQQEYLALNEAARIMRISRSTLFRLMKQGKLKKKKVLSRTVIQKKDIQRFFNQL